MAATAAGNNLCHTRNSLILWDAFVNEQLHTPGAPGALSWGTLRQQISVHNCMLLTPLNQQVPYTT